MKTGVESYSCIFISSECTLFKGLDNYSNNFKCPNINSQYEPPRDKTNNVAVRPANSGQPGHLLSLIRVFAVRSKVSLGPKLSSCGQRRL